MALIFKTEYGKYSRPQDDPVWKRNGLHAGSGGDRVMFMDDPLQQHGKVLRFRVDGGGKDVVFGTTNADRAEVMNDRMFHEGDHIVLATRILLKDYHSGSSTWNLVAFEAHDGNPGPTQSPIGNYVQNDNQLGVRLWGGPVSSNGNTGTLRRDDLRGVAWPDRNGWVDIVQHILFSPDPGVGVFQTWLGGKLIWDTKAATIVKGHPAYLKHGCYRGTVNLTSMYYATDFGCFSTVEEGHAFLGSAAPPPPQVPFQSHSAIQKGDEISAGQVWEITTDVGAAAVAFEFNGKLVATDSVADAATPMSEVYAATIPADAQAGTATLGYTVYDKAAKPLKVVPAFPVTVKAGAPPPPPPVDPKAAAQAAIDDLKANNPGAVRIIAAIQATLDYAASK